MNTDISTSYNQPYLVFSYCDPQNKQLGFDIFDNLQLTKKIKIGTITPSDGKLDIYCGGAMIAWAQHYKYWRLGFERESNLAPDWVEKKCSFIMYGLSLPLPYGSTLD